MEESKFFKFVWRCNGLILLVAGVLAIGVAAVALYAFVNESTQEQTWINIVNAQNEDDFEDEWRLGQMMPIHGSPYAMIPLWSTRRNAQSDYGKSGPSAWNYLFINSETNESRWIFESNEYLIANAQLIPNRFYSARQEDVRVILYEVVKKDTDDDDQLTTDDSKTISISRPNGRGYTEVVENVDVFVGQAFFDNDKLLIVYQKDGVGYSVNVDLSGLVVSNETKLPKVGPAQPR